jgi:isopentenyl-diphosphate delta-isomerase
VPVLIKEVGNGISARTARRLAELPIAGVEVAGTGGTSWAAVEAYRAGDDKRRAGAGIRLAGFGVPTIDSLQIVRDVVPDKVVVASGGVRSGMDVAVALALGADAVALAKPFLDAAEEGGEDAVAAAIEELLFDLRVICFCAGAKNLEELRQCRVIDVTKGYR